MNRVTLIGRLGASAEISKIAGQDDRYYAKFRIATDEGYKDKDTGEWVDRASWHSCITFQKGLVEILRKHGERGRLVAIEGELRHDKSEGKDGKDDKYFTTVLVGMQGSVKFLTPKAKTDDAEPPHDEHGEVKGEASHA
jgi:single-strand DNA-binding protein